MSKLDRYLPIAVLLGFIIPGVCCFLFAANAIGISIPSSEELGRAYLNAVVTQTIEVTSNPNVTCGEAAEKQAKQEEQTYGGAEVRSVSVKLDWDTRQPLEYVKVEFEYRPKNSSDWRKGEISLQTNYTAPDFRHLYESCFTSYDDPDTGFEYDLIPPPVTPKPFIELPN